MIINFTFNQIFRARSMGKKDRVFKFVVDGAFSKCSQVWPVKLRKNDVYI